jgi:hypothetical protein
MNMVRATGASIRRNEVRGGNGPGQFCDNLVHARARSLLVRRDKPADEQRHFFSLEVQVAQQAFVNAFHFVGPLLVVVVGFALVQENAFDDAVILREPRRYPRGADRIAAVGLTMFFIHGAAFETYDW